jgi:hypothetical protein
VAGLFLGAHLGFLEEIPAEFGCIAKRFLPDALEDLFAGLGFAHARDAGEFFTKQSADALLIGGVLIEFGSLALKVFNAAANFLLFRDKALEVLVDEAFPFGEASFAFVNLEAAPCLELFRVFTEFLDFLVGEQACFAGNGIGFLAGFAEEGLRLLFEFPAQPCGFALVMDEEEQRPGGHQAGTSEEQEDRERVHVTSTRARSLGAGTRE